MTRWCCFCGPARSKTPRPESFFWWSLVTLPTSSVGSQVTISWPWPYQNTFRDPTYILIAYDPTVQLVTVSMGFVWQVQQFRCLWDVLPWPYTCWLGSVKWLLCGRCSNFDASEMISPHPIHACWEVSNGFCVAGAAILMPLRWSPLTLYMLVGKCQMAFVWQVQQFRCLWDVLPWPYTCLLGRVKWLLSGRCNNFDASDPIHACWEGSNGFCVAGATILMPLRWSPLTLYMLVGKGRKWLTVTLCGRRNSLNASEKYYVTQCLATGDPTCLLCGRCRILDGSEKFLVYTFCLCGRCNILDTSEKVTVTLREVPRDTSSFLWQVPSLPASSSAWPYTFALCGRRNIFFDASEHWLCDLDPRAAGDPTSFLCGRCNNFDASEMFSPDPIHACWEGSQVIDSDFAWPAQ